jgi:hypothetical protein
MTLSLSERGVSFRFGSAVTDIVLPDVDVPDIAVPDKDGCCRYTIKTTEAGSIKQQNKK